MRYVLILLFVCSGVFGQTYEVQQPCPTGSGQTVLVDNSFSSSSSTTRVGGRNCNTAWSPLGMDGLMAWYKNSATDLSGNSNTAALASTSNANDAIELPSTLKSYILADTGYFYDAYEYTGKPYRLVDPEIKNNKIFTKQNELLVYDSAVSGTDFENVTNYLYGLKDYDLFLNTQDYQSYSGHNSETAQIIKKPWWTNAKSLKINYKTGQVHYTDSLTVSCRHQTVLSSFPTAGLLFGPYNGAWEFITAAGNKYSFTVFFASGSLTITTDSTYNDGKEHILMGRMQGDSVIFQTEKERKASKYNAGQTALYPTNDTTTYRVNKSAGRVSATIGYVNDLAIWHAKKTWTQVNNLDTLYRVLYSWDGQTETELGRTTTLYSSTWAATLAYVFEIALAGNYLYNYSTRIDINPTNSTDAKYQLWDRRNVVGNTEGRPEIWAAVLYNSAHPFQWDIGVNLNVLASSIKYSLCQAMVEKYAQGNYKNMMYVIEDKDLYGRQRIKSIFSYNTLPASSEITYAHSFIGWPESLTEPSIVGDGVTDDATAINTALLSGDVMLYRVTARPKTPIRIPSNRTLIIADSRIFIADSTNDNVIRNRDYVNGNTNIKILGQGYAIINGNGLKQRAYDSYDDSTSYHQFGINLVDVSGFKIKGLWINTCRKYASHFQYCQNGIIDDIRINNKNTGLSNQDGIDMNYGSKNIYVNSIYGETADDFMAFNQFKVNQRTDFMGNTKTGTIGTIYVENLDVTTVRNYPAFYPSLTYTIDGITARDIYSRNCINAFFFSDYSYSVTGTQIKNITLKNILTSATNPFTDFVLFDADVEDVLIKNVKIYRATTDLIDINAGFSIKDVTINTDLYVAPTNILNDGGGVLDNFNHTETTHY